MKNLKAVTLEGAGFISWQNYQQLPWWIADVVTRSQLSLYEHVNSRSQLSLYEHTRREETRVFQLRPLLEVESVPRLPLLAFYKGDDVYVETVSIPKKRLGIEQGAAKFLSYNCLQLYGRERDDSNVRSRLEVISSSIASNNFQTALSGGADIGACYRGGNIPDWFSKRSWSGTSKTNNNELNVVIYLSQNSLKRPDFLGFAVCATFAIRFDLDDHDGDSKLQLLCKPHFIGKYGCKLSWNFVDKPDHNWNTEIEKGLLLSGEGVAKVGFEFSLSENYKNEIHTAHRFWLRECGVHPLYDTVPINLGLPNQQDLNQKAEEDYEISEVPISSDAGVSIRNFAPWRFLFSRKKSQDQQDQTKLAHAKSR